MLITSSLLAVASFLLWQERRIRRLRGELREVRQDQLRIERNLKARDTAAEIIRAANANPIPEQRTGRRSHLRVINGGRALALALIGGALALLTKYRDRTVATVAALSATTAVGSTVFVFVPMESDNEPSAEGSSLTTTVIRTMPAPSTHLLAPPIVTVTSSIAPTSTPTAETTESVESAATAVSESDSAPSATGTTEPDAEAPVVTTTTEPTAESTTGERVAGGDPDVAPASPDEAADDTREAEQPPPRQRQPRCENSPAPALCGLVADLGNVAHRFGELLRPTGES